MKTLAILGGGSWGTALAITLSRRFESVNLWVRRPKLCAALGRSRENAEYLPGFRIAENVRPTSVLADAVRSADVVVGVVPAQHSREIFTGALPYLNPNAAFVSASKGLENGSLLRVSEIIQQVLRARFQPRIAVLSGPTFALEIAAGEPAAVVIAAENAELAASLQAAFSTPAFRLYTNDDPIGVEVGAALKNVIAIGAGICKGLGLGSNATAALITRGLAELSRLATALGGQARTLSGLAGLGDLVLTCTGDLSRNRKVGLDLARGLSLPEIVSSTPMVAEGIYTTAAAVELARRAGVELPITEQMYAILHLGKSPAQGLRDLMDRALKQE